MVTPRDAEVSKFVLAAELRAPRLIVGGWERVSHGADGLGMWRHFRRGLSLIHSVAREGDGLVWGHTSIANRDRTFPAWLDLRDAHRLIYPAHAGIIVIPPEAEHVNISETSHIFACLTGTPLPDFTRGSGSL